jgi:hypothetical protein
MEPFEKDNNKCQNVYQSISNYHNNLVQIRFTVAGLFLTASGFLIGAWNNSTSPQIKIYLPVLGIFITIIILLLEIRNRSLLENLALRGLLIEKMIGIDKRIGFFYLMQKQPYGPKDIFSNKRIENKCLIKLSTHRYGLGLLYICFLMFWIRLLFC